MTPAERQIIEWECRQLALRFTAHCDRQEWQQACALLSDDAEFVRPTDPDNPIVGRSAIQAAFEARPASRITRHICTNLIVTARSDSEASGYLYALLYTGDSGDEDVTIADERQYVGEFEDDYRRTGDGWRIARRVGKLIFSTR
ncbi:MAG: nuclear transport factor 2 family protein [Woeseiaceae bacterium]|nr:nuclear transport factor 2 family protein [Woeseiaceae bacterium]